MRYYSSTAAAVDLTGSISNSATSITVSSTTGFPGTTPYTLVLDPDQATEEIVEVTNVSGLTLTITRAVDGSSAQAHSAGVANVQHMATARDYREPQEHIAASANVHGLAGGSAVVGTDTVQTLKNKTATAATAGTVGLSVQGVASQTANYFEVKDSGGNALLKVAPTATGLVQVNNTTFINGSDQSFFSKYTAKLKTYWNDTVGLIITRGAAQTANLMEVRAADDTTVLARFDKDANLTVPSVTSTGAVTASGAVTGATGTFSGAVSTGGLTAASVASTGAVSGTTGTFSGAVSGTTGTFTGNVTAPNLPAVIAGDAGKRMHFFKKTGVTPNGTGYATVTHGCGFTPSLVFVTTEQAYAAGVDPANINSLNFQVRLLNPTADTAVTTATDVFFLCFE